MTKCSRTLGTLVLIVLAALVLLMVLRTVSGELRTADLQRMDNAGYRCELTIDHQDKGPFSVGQRATIGLKVKNTGSVVWKEGEKNYIALGGFTRNQIDFLVNREGHGNAPQLRITPGFNVKPGDSYCVDVGLENLPLGVYEHRYQMVKEGNPPQGGWFGPIVVYRFEVR